MPVLPLILGGASVIGGAIGDLFGNKDAERDIASANRAFDRQEMYFNQAVADYRQEQYDKARLAGAQQDLVARQAGLKPVLLSGDVSENSFTPRITY